MGEIKTITFAAKIRWRMKYDRNPLLTQLQDKLAVKKYAANWGVPSAIVLYETVKPETIPFDDLPEKCFIKANHGRNWNILKYGSLFFDFMDGENYISLDGFYSLDDKNIKQLSQDEIIDICSKWLTTSYRPIEWAYNNIVPAVFIEELIEPEPRKETMDYRLFTFEGKVAAISVGSPSMRKKDENIFFDHVWNIIPVKNNFEKEPETIPEKPPFLYKMIEAAKLLGKELDFVRIDFFANHSQFFLSEMTIYPNGGQDNRPTSDEQFNLFLSKQWKMNPLQLIQAYWLELGHRLRKALKKK